MGSFSICVASSKEHHECVSLGTPQPRLRVGPFREPDGAGPVCGGRRDGEQVGGGADPERLRRRAGARARMSGRARRCRCVSCRAVHRTPASSPPRPRNRNRSRPAIDPLALPAAAPAVDNPARFNPRRTRCECRRNRSSRPAHAARDWRSGNAMGRRSTHHRE